MSQLSLQGVCKEYPTRAESLVVLRQVELQLSSGENVGILGPSGSGKSTLLHLLGTLERPTSGHYQLDSQRPFDLDEPALAKFRNEKIGFVFQDHHLLSQCSALENVLIPVLAAGSVGKEQLDRAKTLLGRVGLSQRVDHRPAELSGGERQRIAIARALMLQPALLLADEPTGNLDRATADSITQLLLELHRQEQTMMVVVTHSSELAQQLDRCLTFDGGQLKSMDN